MKKRITLKFLTIALPAALSFLIANTARAQDDGTVRITTNLVQVGVTVRDPKGKVVQDLKEDQFEIFDNGVRQKIEVFSDASGPVSYGVVYDLHPTTPGQTRSLLSELKRFADGLPDDDDLFTVVFNEGGSLAVDFVPTIEQVENQLDARSDVRSLYDAIALAGTMVRGRQNAKRTLIIVSDGKNEFSHHSFTDLSRRLRAFNVQVFAVLLRETRRWGYSDLSEYPRPSIVEIDRSRLDKAALEELSRTSGGLAGEMSPENVFEIRRMLRSIGLQASEQYSLGFYPESSDGKWHRLKVALKPGASGDLRLTYRRGYQSQAPVK